MHVLCLKVGMALEASTGAIGWTLERLRMIKETRKSRTLWQAAVVIRELLLLLLVGSHCTLVPITVSTCWWAERKWGRPSAAAAMISFPLYIIDQLIKDFLKWLLCVVGQKPSLGWMHIRVLQENGDGRTKFWRAQRRSGTWERLWKMVKIWTQKEPCDDRSSLYYLLVMGRRVMWLMHLTVTLRGCHFFNLSSVLEFISQNHTLLKW